MATWIHRASANPGKPGLLIVGGDRDVWRRLAAVFAGLGHTVAVTDSAPEAVADVLRGATRVVVIDKRLDGCRVGELVPLLKRCNPFLSIILVSGDAPVPLLRKLRREGLFYHALEPLNVDDLDEVRQAVCCAFDSVAAKRADGQALRRIARNPDEMERRIP